MLCRRGRWERDQLAQAYFQVALLSRLPLDLLTLLVGLACATGSNRITVTVYPSPSSITVCPVPAPSTTTIFPILTPSTIPFCPVPAPSTVTICPVPVASTTLNPTNCCLAAADLKEEVRLLREVLKEGFERLEKRLIRGLEGLEKVLKEEVKEEIKGVKEAVGFPNWDVALIGLVPVFAWLFKRPWVQRRVPKWMRLEKGDGGEGGLEGNGGGAGQPQVQAGGGSNRGQGAGGRGGVYLPMEWMALPAEERDALVGGWRSEEEMERRG
ncbi:hypothetical protein B0T21DRAFT_412788 [Apiosordaria backusii]|uniref:Uncharacterized protein n=1 Tax=Apiosordaria backusii TaxID=314023 RepID=A0AA40BEU5_9PEZI|nr:hypothetical protein B0T21DRAFT_412788 [Apiosordaria backusii]